MAYKHILIEEDLNMKKREKKTKKKKKKKKKKNDNAEWPGTWTLIPANHSKGYASSKTFVLL